MNSRRITGNLNANLDEALSLFSELLSQNEFSLVSKLELKANSDQTKLRRYVLIRGIYPKNSLMNNLLATPACSFIRFSILLKETSKALVEIELSRSSRFPDLPCGETSKIAEEADKKLNAILDQVKVEQLKEIA